MRILIRTMLYATVACIALTVLVALGFRFGIVTNIAWLSINPITFGLSAVIATICVIVLFIKILKRNPDGLFTTFFIFVLCFFFAGYGAVQLNKILQSPPIHNVSTDLENPPTFSPPTLEARGEYANPVAISEQVRNIHQNGYPDIQTLSIELDVASVYDAVLKQVESQGWEIQAQDPMKGSIDATATTFWYGFKDDIVIRVLADDESGTTSVDMRSVSRIGQVDLGVNADRIRGFIQALATNLQ